VVGGGLGGRRPASPRPPPPPPKPPTPNPQSPILILHLIG